MGEFVHVYNDGGGIRDVPILQGAGVVLGGKDRNPVNSSGPCSIAVIGTPFAILPGDGAAVGMFFTGTAGAFTLSAAILTNLWNALKGCWCYLPANFGGKTYPAGWYWAVFSSDTAGILYNNTYSSGVPARPATLTPFADNLTGWLTTTTAEITGPTGFVLPGGSMGKNGILTNHYRVSGNSVSSHTVRGYVGSTAAILIGATSSNPHNEGIVSVANQGSEVLQIGSRRADPTGVGVSGGSANALESSAVDTTVDQTLSMSLQITSTSAAVVLLFSRFSLTYGA